jgi:hypothetical protein
VVSAEQLQKARLGPGRSLDSARSQSIGAILEIFQVENQILQPQAGSFAEGGRLSRLEMREAETGGRAFGCGERGESVDGPGEALPKQVERPAEQDQVGVVGDEAAGRPQVDDRASRGATITELVDVSDDVVPLLALVRGGSGEVDVVDMFAHLIDLRLSDLQPELPLRLGQGDPQAAPGPEPFAVSP